MCDDVNAFIAELKKHNIAFDPVQGRGNGADASGWRQARRLSAPTRASEGDECEEGEIDV